MPPPRRIVSLVPSLTELIVWLAEPGRLVGRTAFCTHPAELAASVPAIGGTKTPRIPAILALRPDLVVANREENRREDVEALRSAGLTVLVTDVNSVRDALTLFAELGVLLGERARAETLIGEVRDALGAETARGLRVAVPIWWHPLLALGAATYGHDVLECAGGVNALGDRQRYPEVDLDVLRAARPDVILLPDEPFPFDSDHAELLAPIAPVRLLDGKLLWWYGPRLPESLRSLRAVLAAY